MVIWLYYISFLIIISIFILLNSLIIFTFYFIFTGSIFQYIKFYLSIIKNWFSYIALLKNILAIIL